MDTSKEKPKTFISAASGAGKTRPVLINNTESGKNGKIPFTTKSAITVKNAPILFKPPINISILLNQSSISIIRDCICGKVTK